MTRLTFIVSYRFLLSLYHTDFSIPERSLSLLDGVKVGDEFTVSNSLILLFGKNMIADHLKRLP